MNGKTIFRLGIAGLAMSLSVLAALLWQQYTTPHVDVERIMQPRPVIEMMDPSTHEWMEQHFKGADGKLQKTKVTYRNKNVGLRIFRADGTLSELTISTPADEVLVHLFYSPKGTQIVSGFERRNDGTMRREARLVDGVVELRTYWQDGTTLFSVQLRKVDDSDFEGTFFHKNGARWLTQKGTVWGQIKEQHRFDEQGRLVHWYRTQDNNIAMAQFFFPESGKVRVHQQYLEYSYEVASEFGVHMGKSRGLKTVEQFDEAERLLRVVTMKDAGIEVDSVRTLLEGAPEMEPAMTRSSLEPLRPHEIWRTEEAKVSVVTESK